MASKGTCGRCKHLRCDTFGGTHEWQYHCIQTGGFVNYNQMSCKHFEYKYGKKEVVDGKD